MKDMKTRGVKILIFDDVEVLDFAGPFEVFSVATRVALRLGASRAPFSVELVADRRREIKARGNFPAFPHAAIDEVDSTSVLIVPGGVVDQPVGDAGIIEWVDRIYSRAEITASVCTGAFILAKAGLLGGRSVTTHWEDVDELQRMYPDVDVRSGSSWVDDGEIVSSAGISAGIDMSLHLVERLASHDLATATARQMEYRWSN